MAVRHTYMYQSGDGIIAHYEFHDGWGSSKQIVNDPMSNTRYEIEWVKQVTQDDDDNSKLIDSKWKALITMTAINKEK
jgi:hypothetical protein